MLIADSERVSTLGITAGHSLLQKIGKEGGVGLALRRDTDRAVIVSQYWMAVGFRTQAAWGFPLLEPVPGILKAAERLGQISPPDGDDIDLDQFLQTAAECASWDTFFVGFKKVLVDGWLLMNLLSFLDVEDPPLLFSQAWFGSRPKNKKYRLRKNAPDSLVVHAGRTVGVLAGIASSTLRPNVRIS